MFRAYIADHLSTSQQEASALQATSLHRKSHWQLPKGVVAPEVEIFIKLLHDFYFFSFIFIFTDDKVKSATRCSNNHGLMKNLPESEHEALASLQRQTDIVTRPGDNGSAMVVQDAVSYEKEAV